MNILISPDVKEWAIGSLTTAIVRHQKHRFNFFHQSIHPRGVAADLMPINDLMEKDNIKFDLWHCHYWHSSEQAMEISYPLRELPKLLSIHNHYQLGKIAYDKYKALVCPTQWLMKKLKGKNIFHIPYGVDLDRYEYIEDYKAEGTIGYIGRVVPHKNLAIICRVAKRLGYKVFGSGYVDKIDYWHTIDKSVLTFEGGEGRGGMNPAPRKDKLYEKMTVFVAYSTDEKETGTLPLLEAMARGVPVMSTRQGMARDIIKDGVNGILFNNETEFETKLKMLMKDKVKRETLRRNAWNTIKNYPEEMMARNVGKVYYKTLYPKHHLISVIMPVYDKAQQLIDNLLAVELNDWPAKEVIVACDNPNDVTIKYVCQEMKRKLRTPIIYLNTECSGYGLAKARNMAAIEAMGEQLLFIDDRLRVRENTLSEVAKWKERKIWYWGAKYVNGKVSTKTEFVENFSWILKRDYMNFGGCNEEITHYGGMSQDLRHRAKVNNIAFSYVSNAAVDAIASSPKRRNDTWKGKWQLYKMYEQG